MNIYKVTVKFPTRLKHLISEEIVEVQSNDGIEAGKYAKAITFSNWYNKIHQKRYARSFTLNELRVTNVEKII